MQDRINDSGTWGTWYLVCFRLGPVMTLAAVPMEPGVHEAEPIPGARSVVENESITMVASKVRAQARRGGTWWRDDRGSVGVNGRWGGMNVSVKKESEGKRREQGGCRFFLKWQAVGEYPRAKPYPCPAARSTLFCVTTYETNYRPH